MHRISRIGVISNTSVVFCVFEVSLHLFYIYGIINPDKRNPEILKRRNGHEKERTILGNDSRDRFF